jgi:hypothetical protein
MASRPFGPRLLSGGYACVLLMCCFAYASAARSSASANGSARLVFSVGACGLLDAIGSVRRMLFPFALCLLVLASVRGSLLRSRSSRLGCCSGRLFGLCFVMLLVLPPLGLELLNALSGGLPRRCSAESFPGCGMLLYHSNACLGRWARGACGVVLLAVHALARGSARALPGVPLLFCKALLGSLAGRGAGRFALLARMLRASCSGLLVCAGLARAFVGVCGNAKARLMPVRSPVAPARNAFAVLLSGASVPLRAPLSLAFGLVLASANAPRSVRGSAPRSCLGSRPQCSCSGRPPGMRFVLLCLLLGYCNARSARGLPAVCFARRLGYICFA